MLKFNDFVHLPELNRFVEQMLHDDAGLMIVAGLDPRSLAAPSGGMLAWIEPDHVPCAAA